jgi:hypothetical protein
MPPKRRPKNQEPTPDTQDVIIPDPPKVIEAKDESPTKKQKVIEEKKEEKKVDENGDETESEDDRPSCMYGENCYRKNPQVSLKHD